MLSANDESYTLASSEPSAATADLTADAPPPPLRRPPNPQQQRSSRRKRAPTSERTHTATLALRDGDYEVAVQHYAGSARAGHPPRLRVWLTRVQDHPLLAAGGGPHDGTVCESWWAEFSPEYIEKMTSKTGNYKRFNVFVDMLVSGMNRSDPSVHLDILTADDLASLQRYHDGATAAVPQLPLPTPAASKRYLILTYMVAFDRVHYPLPLAYSPQHAEPTTLLSIVHSLREENADLRHQLATAPTAPAPLDLDHIEATLADFQSQIAALSHDLDDARANALRWQAMYEELAAATVSAATASSRAGSAARSSTGSTSARQSRYTPASSPARYPHQQQPSPRAKPAPAPRTANAAATRPPWHHSRSRDRVLPNTTATAKPKLAAAGYVPLRSAPLRSSGYGANAGTRSQQQQQQPPARAPFKRFDPTEWARQRAERIGGGVPEPTAARRGNAGGSPLRRTAWSPHRQFDASPARSRPLSDPRQYSPGPSSPRGGASPRRPLDHAFRGSPVRSSGYGYGVAPSPPPRTRTKDYSPSPARSSSGYGLVRPPARGKAYSPSPARSSTAAGPRRSDSRDIEDRLGRLADMLRQAREEVRLAAT
ncbi:hypothetical protein H9P43_005353 [Blastocladiella emersonii ATCC 22665]|nr:hypothetical protein H9P43_005353 [Blastocladiella emersonii ATCC 22665]